MDRNFALERYSARSKCFDHTDQMWEERSCQQVRQWQHWGSGCYEYKCADGRLHILVLNHTYTCFYPQQEISISLMANGWLHKGSLVCPACADVCAEELAARGETCRTGILPPKNYVYYEDYLACNGATCWPMWAAVSAATLLAAVVR